MTLRSGFEAILYEKRNGIGYVTLNRPKNLNAYNLQMRDELYQVLGAIKEDSEVRVAIFRGAGENAFCAGADLTEFLTAPSPVMAREIRLERDIWGLFLSIKKPLIAVLHGYVLGSGLEIALCCDIRIASEDARFSLPEVGLGIIPAAGGTQTLGRTIGKGKAMEMVLTGQWVSAKEAFYLKLVNQVVPRHELFPVSEKLANRIKTYKASAISYAKEAIIKGLDKTLEQGLELEAQLSHLVLLNS